MQMFPDHLVDQINWFNFSWLQINGWVLVFDVKRRKHIMQNSGNDDVDENGNRIDYCETERQKEPIN